MIWFGHLELLRSDRPSPAGRTTPELARMEQALHWVAERAPQLRGEGLARALSGTGLVDLEEARRLLPLFSRFDADTHFADGLRRLSFQGATVEDEFHRRVGRVLVDLTGRFALTDVEGQRALRFRHGDREGLVLAYPQVAVSVGPPLVRALTRAVEDMPDAIVLVARSFRPDAEAQLRGVLHGSGVPGTLVTVNRLLGVRAVTLAYRPPTDDVVDLLCCGRTIDSPSVAHLADRSVRVAAAR